MQRTVPRFTLRGMMIITAIVAGALAAVNSGSPVWMALVAILIELIVAVFLFLLRSRSAWVLIVAIAWLIMGLVAGLPWLGFENGEYLYYLEILPSMVPAVPFYLIDTRSGARDIHEGLFWVSGHSPPFLKPLGIVVVYIIPASIGIWRWVRSGPSASS